MVEGVAVVLRELAISSAALALYEAFGVVLALAMFARCATLDDVFRPCDLLLPDVPQVFPVLKREGHDESLLQLMAFLPDLYPTLAAEEDVSIFLGIELREVIFFIRQLRIVSAIEQHSAPSLRLRGPVLQVSLQLLE